MTEPEPPVEYNDKNWGNFRDYQRAYREYEIKLKAYWEAKYMAEAISEAK